MDGWMDEKGEEKKNPITLHRASIQMIVAFEVDGQSHLID